MAARSNFTIESYLAAADLTTLDDNSNYFDKLIYKQSITDKTQASFVFAGAKAMVAA